MHSLLFINNSFFFTIGCCLPNIMTLFALLFLLEKVVNNVMHNLCFLVNVLKVGLKVGKVL